MGRPVALLRLRRPMNHLGIGCSQLKIKLGGGLFVVSLEPIRWDIWNVPAWNTPVGVWIIYPMCRFFQVDFNIYPFFLILPVWGFSNIRRLPEGGFRSKNVVTYNRLFNILSFA